MRRIGDVEVTRIEEVNLREPPIMFAEWRKEMADQYRDWLLPNFYIPEADNFHVSIHSWLLRTPRHTIVIDTCGGNAKERPASPRFHHLDTPYLERLKAAGVAPEDVDYVVCTHLHVDHVGWNTRLVDGRWMPTFPRAKYVWAGEEWEYWRHEKDACIADSVVPVVEAGQAVFVDVRHEVDPWLRFEPSPGHTPGHVCVRLSTDAGQAVFSGDLMHRVVQVAEPQWSSRFCADPKRAATTRREFIERHADSGVLVLAAHFPKPGYIVREDGGTRFVSAR
jgi:glyoxylase-like metal-dependent hydrolase (beta-lactamase superfamily II)